MSRSGSKMGLLKKLAVGAMALGLVFNAAAAGAGEPADAFDEFWGNDMTTSQFAHDGVSALFARSGYAVSAKSVYERHMAEMQDPVKREVVNDFLESLEQYRGEDLDVILKGVDGAVDRFVDYEFDQDTYGQSEYWATPYETISRAEGDCEDYAILKYFALQHLGVSQDALRLTVLNDNSDGGHANLLAAGEGGSLYFLNNDGYANLIPQHNYHYDGSVVTMYNFTAAGADLINLDLDKVPVQGQSAPDDGAISDVIPVGKTAALIGLAGTLVLAMRALNGNESHKNRILGRDDYYDFKSA